MAVLSVILAHAEVPGFAGGFVGVDVFFVISGFLITGILQREIGSGTFSLLHFYERRARRILPALFLMLAVTALAGWFVFPPFQYEAFAKTALATLTFLSNLQLRAAIGDYFGAAAVFEPLLHTWSLAVEEQFYIVWPLLLVLLMRIRGAALLGLLALTLLSFAISVAVTDRPFDNFFLIQTRAWELGIGALLALGLLPATASRAIRETVASVGLLAILASVLVYTERTPFPGATALLPGLGAAAIIWAGATGQSAVTRFLSTPPLVGIGLISYSLYLWHWPPLVMARGFSPGGTLTPLTTAIAIGIAFLGAYLSWRYVERPFRQKQTFSRRAIFTSAGIGAALIAGFALLALRLDGFAHRLPADLRTAYDEAVTLEQGCLDASPATGLCHLGKTDVDASVLLWGDSHMGVLAPGFDEWLASHGTSGVAAVKVGCLPLIDVVHARHPLGCAAHNAAVLAHLETQREIETVILTGRWAFNTEGTRAPGEYGGPAILALNGESESPEGGNRAVVRTGLDRTLRALSTLGKRIILLEGTPEMGVNVPKEVLFSETIGRPLAPFPDRAAYDARNRGAHEIMANAIGDLPVIRLSVADFLCPDQCPVMKEGAILYRDDDHVASSTARWLIPEAFKDITP